ncbi:hypothetical protein FIBSPDRAFT_927429 [Athelia psychrophila]|uniref:Zn(2)-C6 fungal-type domain-containing protein n=1 Tax=Athelia psychrophila TaxID=1759441 RepID=A0A166RTT6_9AGAM|nr:hypothetical protein FIBSPDRAFT_927429 [Fibularhizoctonia sp. CBS 109695]
MDQDTSAGRSVSSLQRGKACITCRRRKMRCDGKKPFCGPCVRSNRSFDCEYTDAQGRSRTQLLEENISRLESRIRELENPETGTPNVVLHNPYSSLNAPTLVPALEIPSHEGLRSSPSDSGMSSPGDYIYALASPSTSPLSPSKDIDHWWASDEPQPPVAQQLLDIFLPNARQFGFFLNRRLFRTSASLKFPLGHHFRPSSALMSTVYLLGIYLSPSPTIRAHESAFLSRALRFTSNALAGSHPHKIIHALQSEILLSGYFFATGRLLEGKYHCSAAAALAISCELYKIRSAAPLSGIIPPTLVGITRPFNLHPPQDSVEEGERIQAFWAVFIMDKCWSVALGSPSHFTDSDALGTRIDTPWPLTCAEYEQGVMSPDFQSASTVHDFQDGLLDLSSGQFSLVAIVAQGAILLERATLVAAQWQAGVQSVDTVSLRDEFLALDNLIGKFQEELVLPGQFRERSPVCHQLLCNGLAYAATIQLHKGFAAVNANSNDRCVGAASAMAVFQNNLDLSALANTHPIMGTIWLTACLVLINEIQRVRSMHENWQTVASGFPLHDSEAHLLACVESIVTTMMSFSDNCALIGFQLAKVQEAYDALRIKHI